jgi:putative transcriptional regulator
LYVYRKKLLDYRKARSTIVYVAIEVRLDLMLARRKMRLTELSQRVGVAMTNLSLLKTGKVKAIRFSTLEALCRELDCQPGELLEFVRDGSGAEKGRVDP